MLRKVTYDSAVEKHPVPGWFGVPVGRIRARILRHIRWPAEQWQFVQTVADICLTRSGWFPYGHWFVGEEMGWTNPDDHCEDHEKAVSQRVRRALLAYSQSEATVGRRLFDWKKGGGRSRAATQYGSCFLNVAALEIQRQLGESIPTLFDIDRQIPQALPLLPHRESAKLRALPTSRKKKPSTTPKTKRDYRDHSTYIRVGVNSRLCARLFPLHSVSGGVCSCKLGPACQFPGKHPRLRDWQRRATNDEKVVAKWLTRWPNSNLGLVCGSRAGNGHLVVLDVDRRRGGDFVWKQLREQFDLSDTFTVRTGNGWHVYFVSPISKLAKDILTGIDVQGWGSYVVAPGSVHFSGVTYEIVRDVPVAALPVDLVEILTPRPRAVELIRDGARHNHLRRVSYAMASRGEKLESIRMELRRERLRCDRPEEITEEELEGLANSAITKAQKAEAVWEKISA